MGNLYARLQEIIGEKIFRHKVTFDKDVVFKQHILAYSPTASEPSWGTKHTHLATLVDNADPAVTTAISVTAEGPSGIKGAFGFFAGKSSATAGRHMSILDSDGNTWNQIANPTTGIHGYGSFDVPVNSNKAFAYSVDNADVDSVYIWQLGYYI